MRGKKLTPSTKGSIVAAVDQAKSSAASRGRILRRAANASVAASAPAGVTASCGGGELGRLGLPSTFRYAPVNNAAPAREARPSALRPDTRTPPAESAQGRRAPAACA